MKRLTIALTLPIILLFTACVATEETQPQATRIENIDRILMHDIGEYTFLIKKPDNTTGRLRILVNETKLQMKNNLNPDESIKIEYTCYSNRSDNGKTCKPIPKHFSYWRIHAQYLIIRMHDAKEIDGAGWERTQGKQHVSGTTIVIE